MVLYDMTSGDLVPVNETSFETENILERAHLQAALRKDISIIDPDLMVVAEEFGWFEGANRRIDLLCIDRTGRLVVVELKRTSDGGHLELQALRYAAMVSTMTFADLVDTYRRTLRQAADDTTDPEQALRNWITEPDEDDGEDPVLSREVRIVLVSAGFDKEITTTVLWLTDVFSLDIQCVRLSPYRHGDRLLLDVQQVIPLPEAAELTVQLRRREQAAKASRGTDNRDWTPYVVTTPHGPSQPLRKRHAIRTVVHALHDIGVPANTIADVLPNSKFLAVDGTLADEELQAALVEAYGRTPEALNKRYFLDSPIYDDDQTWVLSNQWGGPKADRFLDELSKLDPSGTVKAAPAPDTSSN